MVNLVLLCIMILVKMDKEETRYLVKLMLAAVAQLITIDLDQIF